MRFKQSALFVLAFVWSGISAPCQISSDLRPAALDEGLVERGESVTLTVTTAVPDEAAFAQAVDQLYDPHSARYLQWMTDQELAKFAPSADSVSRVRAALRRSGLLVVDGDPNGFSLVVQGPVEAAERAFGVSVHQFSRGSERFRVTLGEPKLRDGAHQFVAAVAGLSDGSQQYVTRMLRQPIDPRTGKAIAPLPLPASSAKAADGSVQAVMTLPFTPACFSQDARTFVFGPVAPLSLPVAGYFGDSYGTQAQPCGLSPAYVRNHYLTDVMATGAQQTVVITAAYGYPFVKQDANALSGSQAILSDDNFREVAPFGRPADPQTGVKKGWDREIAFAVQWVNQIAPGAKIVLLLSKDDSAASFLASETYIVSHHLGHIVSNGWAIGLDGNLSPADAKAWTRVLQLGAAQGINFNFASGNNGDNGLPGTPGAPYFPASSQYVTAVGGTSLIKIQSGDYTETGWGSYRTDVAAQGALAVPLQRGFFGGSGGGESSQFVKPLWQEDQPGSGRQVPDIATVADPYTSGVYVLTVNGQPTLQLTGGTSMSVATFAAFWALVDQVAQKPLGQAAPQLTSLNGRGLVDIVSFNGVPNVQGTVINAQGETVYAPPSLFSDEARFPYAFYSAIWPYSTGSASVFSFGTDTSLSQRGGWDQVTGWGVPHFDFIDEITRYLPVQ